MGFAQATQQNYGKSSGSNAFSPFYFLRIRAEEQSPQCYKSFDGGPQMWGYFENVQFLSPLEYATIIWYHPTNTSNTILCNKTWDSEAMCPACIAHDTFKVTHGTTPEAKKNYPIKFWQQGLYIPVFVPRRQNGRHVYKGKAIVRPLYWLEMQITEYIDEGKEHWNRIRTANEKMPIHKTPYTVFKNDSSKKAEYWFEPVQYTQEMQCVDDHPVLQALLLPNGQGINDNPQFFNFFGQLALLNHKPYVDPSTGQAFDYGGHYPQAVQAFNYVKEHWPSASTKIEAPSPYQAPQQQQFPQQYADPNKQPAPYYPPQGQQPMYPGVNPNQFGQQIPF